MKELALDKIRDPLFLLAHPDDEALFFGVILFFLNRGISPHFLFYTAGECGIPKGSGLQPPEVAKIRTAELARAMQSIGATHELLDFPDMGVALTPQDALLRPAMRVLRGGDYDALFSFHPEEYTPIFDHPDHRMVGMVAAHAGAAADVAAFMPSGRVPDSRPALLLRTTNPALANRRHPVARGMAEIRDRYLIDNHPSQFGAESQPVWTRILQSTLRHGLLGQQYELYSQIR